MERTLSAPTRDLTPLFDPKSVAIVGASATPGKWGNWLARNALKGKDRRRIFLVNRSGGEVFGQTAFRSLSEVPQQVELVVLAIGAAGFEQAVSESLAAGAKVLVGITAGLGETGEPGLEIERRAVARVRSAGAILLGPNCLGVVDTSTNLNLAFGDFSAGPVALVSQSGNLALELALIAREAGLGFSRFVSVGNQADLHLTELIEALSTHEPTRVIAVYAEDFADGRAFARAALRAAELGKPVVLLTVGSSNAGARAARSHTGALVSGSVAIDAACNAAGIVRATTPREMIELTQGLLMRHQPRGRRVGVVGDGGGHVALAADLVNEHGLELPALSPELAARIGAFLPSNASTANPVDLAGGGEQDFFNYERTVRMLNESAEVDAVLLTGYFGGYSDDAEQLARKESEVAQAMSDSSGPLIVHTMYPRSAALEALRSAHIPVYGDIRSAARVLARLVDRIEQPRGEIPMLPSPAVVAEPREGYFAVRSLMAAAGIPFGDAREVTTAAEARAAAASIGYPVALKSLGSSHKSDAGGVRLGIHDEAALIAAFTEMEGRLKPASWSVEEMANPQGAIELIVGARRDRSFGPVLVVGVGGIYTELLADVSVALAPASADTAEQLIRSLKAAPLLLGLRGAPPLDVKGAARVAAALSQLLAAQPNMAEAEINPLLVRSQGVVALDARILS